MVAGKLRAKARCPGQRSAGDGSAIAKSLLLNNRGLNAKSQQDQLHILQKPRLSFAQFERAVVE
jgi:hypothetical protein